MRREPPRIGRTCRLRALCTTIPDDRGDESFADDLNMGRGIVSGRVALLLRSTEIPPHRPKDFPTKLIDPQIPSKSTHRYHLISFLSPKNFAALRAEGARGPGSEEEEGKKERGGNSPTLGLQKFYFPPKIPALRKGAGGPRRGPKTRELP